MATRMFLELNASVERPAATRCEGGATYFLLDCARFCVT
jgi:hypothetical protein